MRLLIDILHPAHVHFFRNIRCELLNRGHEVRFTARDKDVTLELLEAFSIEADVISTQRRRRLGLALEMFTRTARLLRIARQWKPDVLVGIMGPSIAPVGRLLRKPTAVLYDTEIATSTNCWVYPLANWVITPASYRGSVKGSHLTYDGFQELAYLHPSRFTPDPGVLPHFGIRHEESYVIVRFVSWEASHDQKSVGLTSDQQRWLVTQLSEDYRVLISAEGDLPPDIEPLRLSGPLEHIHHLLAFAQGFVGESATMASEAAMLGVPAVYVAEESRGYIDAEAEAGLVQVSSPENFDHVLSSISAFIQVDQVAHASRHQRFLDRQIDVTDWLCNWLENVAGPGPKDGK